jgi:hypothetical protein
MTGIEYHCGASRQGDSMSTAGEKKVLTDVIAQKQIAKCHAAVKFAVMVVPCTVTCHECHIAGGQYIAQCVVTCPLGDGLHAAFVVWPA